MPCKTTSNKTATWSNSKLPKSETSLTENVKLISLKPAASDNRNQQEKPLVSYPGFCLQIVGRYAGI